MEMRRAYLVGYNGVEAMGWMVVLTLAVRCAVERGRSWTYDVVRDALVTVQIASFAEVLHALIGLTRTPAAAALMQWAGRTHCLLCALDGVRSNHSSDAATVLVFAWAITEVIRYPAYVCGLLGIESKALTWARYTVFVPLYPLGAGAEMKLMYDARAHARRTKMYAIEMPNAYNFAFDYPTFLNALLVLYPFLFHGLYSYMFAQRRKKLGGKEKQS
ncbi:Protein-tyrosine phosphatase-like, PTPLA [Ostreococcus tauri]|uniref:Very-long-chain (3R)-3-hydroxyacyl-CoA dehydratase n=1 Tax=Ostreococcus tauri TaxID=70448 RepID=Q018N9_OSTTA|nr:Protein-tyrosine phosphatase-like, PTPLA [Ostreococcus tauri]OUS47842.1 protein tyrosine phosphatase-like protein [Ostreococcus tauri]CAL54136.1 Protein-tyrosine phosphatase-like, PTPLA [Ostreococcus tauri]|eukprot:XP_003079478.1 Protein-tyrosine phosphatase-like, PTPLA [Ostreococcus tauri]